MNQARPICTVPVLMYHSVDLQSTDYVTIAVERFRQQVAHLSRAYNVMPARAVLDAMARKESIRPNTIVITFDDAMEDNYIHAVPPLLEFGASATFFTPAGLVGQDNRWNRRAFRILKHMTAAQLVELQALGFDIESHALTHHRLTKLPNGELEAEFTQSQALLATVLGRSPELISYPYGDADMRCRTACARHYRLGFCTSKQGVYNWCETPTWIRRIYVGPGDGPAELDVKIGQYRDGTYHEG